MLSYENLTTCIKCKNEGEEEELKELGVERNGNVVSCWIESFKDQTFTVHFGENGCSTDLRWTLSIDGIMVHKYVINKTSQSRTDKFGGYIVDDVTLMPFQFSPTILVDEGSDDLIHKPGIIELQVYKVIATFQKADASIAPSTGQHYLLHEAMSEKGKSLAPHRIKLGAAISMAKSNTSFFNTEPYDPLNPGPYVTFRFQYRPREFLQAQGILPADIIVPNADNVIDLMDEESEPNDPGLEDEIKEAEKRVAEEEKRLRLLREKRLRRASPYIKREVKLENSGINTTSSRLNTDAIQVIDLTDD